MTPAARVAAAIDLLARALAGEPAEQVLTGWARGARYAGSGDRQAIRDLVFDGLRRRRSLGWIGAGEGFPETGLWADPAAEARAILIGALRDGGQDPAALFTGLGHAPVALQPAEARSRPLADAPPGVRLDCPDWLLPLFGVGGDADADGAGAATLAVLQGRAPVTLRVNAARGTRDAAAAALAAEGIETVPLDLSPTALRVTAGARRVAASTPYRDGRVELQDAASQALTDGLPLRPGARVLDYCAGGGGKVLALAAREPRARYTAHDAAPARMRDLPARAARAGARIALVADAAALQPGSHDLVLCDAPCSGSGTWRRSPQAKWLLTPERLADLLALQARILDEASRLVAPGGTLAYATCALFAAENAGQVAAFLSRHAGWRLAESRAFAPDATADGFYVAHLTR